MTGNLGFLLSHRRGIRPPLELRWLKLGFIPCSNRGVRPPLELRVGNSNFFSSCSKVSGLLLSCEVISGFFSICIRDLSAF